MATSELVAVKTILVAGVRLLPHSIGMKLVQAISVIAASLLLAGCTLPYEIELVSRNGRTVFLLRSGSEPATVRALIVSQMARNAPAVWKIESSDLNGQSQGEIVYGAVPVGMIERVKAIPLQIGRVYRVDLLGLGGTGSKQFVITPGPGPERPISQLLQ